MLLENLNLFLLIIEKGNMSAAAREYGLSPARVSERLSELETHYNTRLLNRTTRSISLTEQGQELAATARHIITEIEEVESKLKLGRKIISGSIHINTTIDFGRNHLAPILDQFMLEHPGINIQLTLDDGYVDLIPNNIDLAIRLGELSDSSMHSKKITINQRIICASPDYLDEHGVPQDPWELENHNCLITKLGNHIDRHWRFLVDGEEKTISVSGNRISNNGELIADWCKAGYGIAFKSYWDISEDIKAGRLVHILKEYEKPRRPLQFVYSAGATNSRRIRLIMDHIVNGLRANAPTSS